MPSGNHDARLHSLHLHSAAFGAPRIGTSSDRWAGSLTGDQAQIGQDYLNGVNLAVMRVMLEGASSDGRSLSLRKMMGVTRSRDAAVATKIVDNPKSVALIGHMCFGLMLAGDPIENKANLPQVTLSHQPKITQQGRHNVAGPSSS
jgi:branched-chain amino acid transport system substrate-binding protein